MKKLLFIAIMTLASLAASAESGDMSASVFFNYASKHSLMGLGAGFQVEPVNNFRIAPEFVYYFKNNGYTAYNVNINLHYLIRSYSSTFYPLAGFSYASFDHDLYTKRTDRFGANVGVGYEYTINPNFRFYIEQKFQILKDWNQSVTTLGMRYKF